MARRLVLIAITILGATMAAAWSVDAGGPIKKYPQTRRGDTVDDYHGTKVADPYRWLEADVRESEEVAAWVKAQNDLTRSYLDGLPSRPKIRARLKKLWKVESSSVPFKAAGKTYIYKNDGQQNQSVLYRMDGEDKLSLILDPNTWSKDGTVALSGLSISPDGKLMAYAVAESGSDWRVWKLMRLDGKPSPADELRWIKFTDVSWTRDSKGFFYGGFDAPAEGQAFQSTNTKQKLYYHRLGTDQSDDVLVYQRPEHPKWGFGGRVTEDGRYLVITVWKGTDDRYQVFLKDLDEPYAMVRELITGFDHEYSFLGNDGPIFYFKTNLDAPRGRVIALDIRAPEASRIRELVAEGEDALRDVEIINNMFVLTYLRDARSAVVLTRLDGKPVREVALPGLGTASGFNGKRSDTETYYSFSSFTTPPSIYRYDMVSGESELLIRQKVAVDPADFVVEQVFYKSKDGTRVPMFLAHRKGLKRDGSNPTLLYGYGGFNIPLTPSFSVSRLAWMEMGGVFAMANLRGGGEYGAAWHKAGTRLQKQNVFDDFIAAAEWLIDNKVSSKKKIGIHGRSNGGLLVGAVMAQRPDLFGACLPQVGVMDMLRFHRFTAGRYWVDDYGSADDPEEFKALLAYSPCHNLEPGTRFPPTLVTTADTDDRVVPLHSFKFAAALQHAQAGEAPTLIRIESRAGHGAGTPIAKLIDEYADLWSFLAENLGLKVE